MSIESNMDGLLWGSCIFVLLLTVVARLISGAYSSGYRTGQLDAAKGVQHFAATQAFEWKDRP